MLSRNYKFAIQNNTGVSLNFNTEPSNDTLDLDIRGYKFNSSGALEYGSLVNQSYSATNVADGGTILLPAVANDVDLFIGLHGLLRVKTNKAASGFVDLYLDISVDGGTTFVSDAPNFVVKDLGNQILGLELGSGEERYRWFEL